MDWHSGIPLLNTTLHVQLCGGKHSQIPPFSFPFLLHREKGWPHPFSADAKNIYPTLFDEPIELAIKAELPKEYVGEMEFEWNGIDGSFGWQIGAFAGRHQGGQRPLRIRLPFSEELTCRITIPPQRRHLQQLADDYDPDVPALFEKLRVFSRTPSCYFGWDWAPAIFPFGVRDMPTVRRWLGCAVRGAGFLNKNAMHELTVFVESDAAREVNVEGCYGKSYAIATVELVPGINKITLIFGDSCWSLQWNPGVENTCEPLDVTIQSDGEIVDKFRCETLPRIVTLKQNGRFDLRSNDVPLSRGANYVEPFFPDCEAGITAQEILSCLVRCGGNTVRIWGGGRYAAESFLSLCDQLGIAVWQDMPFACGCCPINTQEDEYTRELEDFLVRSAHHPSLALICGGNENEWLFGSKRTREERDFFASSEGCQKTLLSLRPDLVYWPDSPFGDGKPNDWKSGDTHEWGFWSGKRPVEVFSEKDYLYISEFGFQAAPSEEVLFGHLSDSDKQNAMGIRQFQERGESILEHYMGIFCPEHCDVPVTASRYSQAVALGLAVRMMRFNEFFSGALVWQLNDVVPAISWSLLDIEGIPKPALSALRWAWCDPAIALRIDDLGLRIRTIGMSGNVVITALSISETCTGNLDIILPSSACNREIVLLSKDDYERSKFVRISAHDDNGMTANFEWWKSAPRLHVTPAMRFAKSRDGYKLLLTSPDLAVVLIESSTSSILPLENPITVFPGEIRHIPIACSPETEMGEMKKAIKMRVL